MLVHDCEPSHSEMFHTSSLYHDDVIDKAATRRGKESVNCRWNQSYSLFAGDYILGVASTRLARTNNPEVGTPSQQPSLSCDVPGDRDHVPSSR